MDATRWNTIRSLFLDALEHAPGERTAWLREACGDDGVLLEEVASLLAAHATEGPVDDLARTLAQPLPDGGVDQRIGPYRTFELLGYGGMGAVYLAERADGQFEQRVALKLVRLAAHPTLRDRLLAERQILARLSHPHIAQLLDGGVTPDGQPYFAMEYVDGVPLTAYADANRLAVAARLRLFLDVCDAVGYAHQNLVIHRDLKPGNILVTADGQVKLLDFGIARLVEEEEVLMPTRTGLRALTPAYASPEQVRGRPMTTASDVYSLGVLLFELLTGHRPYDVADLPPSEIERIVCDVEPGRPSTVVEPAGATLRATSADTLRRRLAGDLDVLVLKALRKEPGKRYATVGALRDDVERYLRGLPIHARPATVGYRARKFVRRHRVPVAAALLVVLALAGGLAAALWQAQVAAAERDRAQVEAEKAEQVAAFLQGLFEESDPELNPASEKTARELLAEGADRIDRELAGQPLVQAQMMAVIGDVYKKLALYDEARGLLERAHSLRRTHAGAAHPDRLVSLRALAALNMEEGAYDSAAVRLDEVLAVQRPDPSTEPAELARTLDLYGSVRQSEKRYAEAEPLYREALAIRKRVLPAPSEDVARSLGNLASLMDDRGEYILAESLHVASLAMLEEVLGEDHPHIGVALSNLAISLYHQERIEEAAPLMERSLAIRKKVYGATHPSVGTGLNNLATVQTNLGNLEEAERLLQESLVVAQEAYGPAHDRVAVTLGNLGTVLSYQERLEEAELYFRQSLAIWQEIGGAEHASVALQLNNIGWVLRSQGRLAEAEPMLREGLAMTRKVYREGHPNIAMRLTNLAVLLSERERFSAAQPFLDEALEIYRTAFGPDHWRVFDTEAMRGRVLFRLGQSEAAEPLLKTGYQGLLAARGAEDQLTQAAAGWLADLYEEQGRADEARLLRVTTE